MPRVRATLWALALGACACEPPAPDVASTVVAPPAAAVPHPAAPAPSTAEPDTPLEPTGATAVPTADCGTADACHEAAVQQERAQHPARAIALYASACDLGSARSCHRAGELVRDGRGAESDDRRAHEFFEQGCARGSPAACDALGH